MNNYKEIDLQAGDTLYNSDNPSDNAWFILSGSVEFEVTLGSKKAKMTIGENQFVGDVAIAVKEKSKLDSISYTAVAKAVNSVKAVQIPIADIEAELALCPPLLKAWFASFINRMLAIVESLSK